LKIIDHIFFKGAVRVLRHAILGDSFAGIYPSDHFPKICDILIEHTSTTNIYRQIKATVLHLKW